MSRKRRNPEGSKGRRNENARPTKAESEAESAKGLPASADGDDEEDLDELLSKLPRDTPPEIVEMVIGSHFSGPLPPPSTFQHYEDVLPGAADRILTMAEEEQQIRRRDNGRILNNESFKIGGSIFVSFSLIAGGVFCAAIGEPEVGGVIATSGAVTGVIHAYLRKKNSQEK